MWRDARSTGSTLISESSSPLSETVSVATDPLTLLRPTRLRPKRCCCRRLGGSLSLSPSPSPSTSTLRARPLSWVSSRDGNTGIGSVNGSALAPRLALVLERNEDEVKETPPEVE